jgi:tetratricopeptide (TPR) repeat protein
MEGFQEGDARQDILALKLRSITHGILTVVFGLLPLIFVPLPTAALEYTKVLVVIFALAIAFIFFSLSVLRSGTVTGSFPLVFLSFFAIVAIAGLSAVFSGDLLDGLIGDTLSIHSAGFLLLLAFVILVWTLVGVGKEWIIRLFMLLIGSTLVLVAYHLSRLFLGADFLSFGVFGNAVSSPIGGWNDLALFLGLTVLLALVTFEQLPLTKVSRIVFSVVVGVALLMLAVINFFMVWLVLGIVSLVLIVYSLGKDRFTDKTLFAKKNRSLLALIVPTAVCIVAFLFVLGGSLFGGMVNRATGISYIEVRPSFGATVDLVRGVYAENAFLGIGTNRFADAWRQHKDRSINETIFWNTDFEAGNGYIPSFLVTNGVLGGLAWIAFLALLLFTGARILLRSPENDRVWYFVATASFVGAVFIWGMSLVYVPGATILLLGALFTGLLLVAGNELNPNKVRTISLAINRRSGFILTLVVMAVIMGSVAVMYGAGRHYASVFTFLKSVEAAQPGVAVETIEGLVASADQLAQNDLYARRIAEYQGALISVPEPTDLDRQQFQTAIGNGVAAARLATVRDATDPKNWATLGALYSVLVATLPATETDQLYELGKQALEEARRLDPSNPSRYLALAELEVRKGNVDEALNRTREAISYKSNYSDGLFFLSQLHVAKGEVDNAIASTEAIVALEPNNPTRYYQLGVLYAAKGDHTNAVAAFTRAVELDQNFANARYFLALSQSALGRSDDAEAQLERVLELNPGNALVTALLEELRTTGRISLNETTTTESQPVENSDGVSQTLDDVTTTEEPNTPLVSPVNTPGETAEENNSVAQ